ncbi:T-cell-interacting, activating receptor on myeloid cells protein 1-like, partial [Numida meleagris]|uniref:T-cell-interacting, activating receptor on myeloid cells protein 1-like n=1 Tax=Numida meleagris TaxID=8996 RepID=UPI000B3E409B
MVPPHGEHSCHMRRWHHVILSPRGSESGFPSISCAHCSLTVPKLLLPHGNNGAGPRPGLVSGGSEQSSVAAPTLPVSAPQPGGVPGGHCHPALPPAPAGCLGPVLQGIWAYTKSNDKEQDVAEFSFITTREHAGTYWCQYEVPESVEASERSDRVQLVVTDHSFPPPSISLHPEERVGTGTNVTICCWNREYGAAFLLHKDGCSAPILRQDPDGGGTATFTLVEVTLTDAGTYRCSYRNKANPFVFSPLGDNVTLEVTPTPAPPGRFQ